MRAAAAAPARHGTGTSVELGGLTGHRGTARPRTGNGGGWLARAWRQKKRWRCGVAAVWRCGVALIAAAHIGRVRACPRPRKVGRGVGQENAACAGGAHDSRQGLAQQTERLCPLDTSRD